MEHPEFMVLVGKSFDTLTPEEAAQALAPELEKLGYVVKKPDVTNPPIEEQTPLPGAPRRPVGYRKGLLIVVGMLDGIERLMEIVSDDPDAFAVRGFDLQYDLLPGIAKPDGPGTPWWGNEEPAGIKQPPGYRKRYFNNGGGVYYERSNLPDETPPKPEVIKPDVPETNDPHLTHVATYGLA